MKRQPKTEKRKSKSADETTPEELIVTEGTIKYRITVSKDGYEFENEASIMADLAGLIICKRVHENMVNEIVKLKEIGLQPQFKTVFNQRQKDLVKSLYTIDKSIKHLFKYSAKTILENQVKEVEDETNKV